MSIVIKALVIDDNKTKRKIVMKGLRYTRLAEFEFTEAGDGVEGLVAFNPAEVDMVFIDWYMPNMDGLGFVKQIRKNKDNAHVKLVMCTTNSSTGAVVEAIDEAGADAFIREPFKPEDMRKELEPLVEEVIARKKKEGGLIGRLFS